MKVEALSRSVIPQAEKPEPAAAVDNSQAEAQTAAVTSPEDIAWEA